MGLALRTEGPGLEARPEPDADAKFGGGRPRRAGRAVLPLRRGPEGSPTGLLDNGIAASGITFPEYLPNGECRVVDPDGYVLMIAQAAADTP
jgi:hypothetical protein